MVWMFEAVLFDVFNDTYYDNDNMYTKSYNFFPVWKRVIKTKKKTDKI